MGWLLQKRLNSISRKSDGGAARMAQLYDLVCTQVWGSLAATAEKRLLTLTKTTLGVALEIGKAHPVCANVCSIIDANGARVLSLDWQ